MHICSSAHTSCSKVRTNDFTNYIEVGVLQLSIHCYTLTSLYTLVCGVCEIAVRHFRNWQIKSLVGFGKSQCFILEIYKNINVGVCEPLCVILGSRIKSRGIDHFSIPWSAMGIIDILGTIYLRLYIMAASLRFLMNYSFILRK